MATERRLRQPEEARGAGERGREKRRRFVVVSGERWWRGKAEAEILLEGGGERKKETGDCVLVAAAEAHRSTPSLPCDLEGWP